MNRFFSLGCFSTMVFNTCKMSKMLRAPKFFRPPPHLLDGGYAPEIAKANDVWKHHVTESNATIVVRDRLVYTVLVIYCASKLH